MATLSTIGPVTSFTAVGFTITQSGTEVPNSLVRTLQRAASHAGVTLAFGRYVYEDRKHVCGYCSVLKRPCACKRD